MKFNGVHLGLAVVTVGWVSFASAAQATHYLCDVSVDQMNPKTWIARRVITANAIPVTTRMPGEKDNKVIRLQAPNSEFYFLNLDEAILSDDTGIAHGIRTSLFFYGPCPEEGYCPGNDSVHLAAKWEGVSNSIFFSHDLSRAKTLATVQCSRQAAE